MTIRKPSFLYADPMFVVAAPKNPWSRRRKVKLADLMNEPWTLPPKNATLTLNRRCARQVGPPGACRCARRIFMLPTFFGLLVVRIISE